MIGPTPTQLKSATLSPSNGSSEAGTVRLFGFCLTPSNSLRISSWCSSKCGGRRCPANRCPSKDKKPPGIRSSAKPLLSAAVRQKRRSSRWSKFNRSWTSLMGAKVTPSSRPRRMSTSRGYRRHKALTASKMSENVWPVSSPLRTR